MTGRKAERGAVLGDGVAKAGSGGESAVKDSALTEPATVPPDDAAAALLREYGLGIHARHTFGGTCCQDGEPWPCRLIQLAAALVKSRVATEAFREDRDRTLKVLGGALHLAKQDNERLRAVLEAGS